MLGVSLDEDDGMEWIGLGRGVGFLVPRFRVSLVWRWYGMGCEWCVWCGHQSLIDGKKGWVDMIDGIYPTSGR